MTWMLASVRTQDEARTAIDAGADILDLKEPVNGPLGAMPIASIRDLLGEIGGRVPVSATIGEIGEGDNTLRDAVAAVAATGVDIVKVGVQGSGAGEARVAAPELTRRGAKLVLVYFAERDWQSLDAGELAANGVSGLMLDTLQKDNGSLLSKVSRPALADFVHGVRRLGMWAGLAGALQAEDVPELLPLEPDFLGFRGGLCRGNLREQQICPRRTQFVRAMIPPSPVTAGPVSRRGVA